MSLKLINHLKNETQLILVLLIYTLSGILLFKFFQHQINGDGIAYIKIAVNYITTNWYNSIDSYHSPLISWLLIHFLIFSQSPDFALYSIKIMSLIIGFFTIIGFELLSRRFNIEKKIKTILMISVIPIILYFVFRSIITPDLLLVCFLLYYFYFIFDPEDTNNISNALLCGFFGGMAFLAKSYAFPFIIAHFLIFNIFHYLKNKSNRKDLLRNLIVGFSVFFIISSLRIGAISSKEGKITYGTAGEFNHDLVGPESNGWIIPYLGEPSANVKHWNTFESWSTVKHQLNIIWNNIIQIISIITNFTYFALIILICYLLLLIRPLNEILKKDKLLFPLVTILIYAGGFSYMSYYWNSEYIGQRKPSLNLTEQIITLKSNDIDYYLLWGDSNDLLLSHYNEITNNKLKV